MDGLWDPPIYEATEDYNCIKDGCRCALWPAHDVIEETVLNEKSCKQVLSILASKADTDIIELEKELMDLLSQLVYTDEELLDMYSMSLRVKISFLDLSIRQLKDDAGDFRSTRWEPAEGIHDIMKSVFCGYLQKKDEQRYAENTTNVASSCLQLCADSLLKEKEQDGGSSKANHMEKAIITSLEKHKSSQIRVKIEEEECEKTNDFAARFNDLHNSVRGSMEKVNGAVNKFQIKSPTMAKDSPVNMTLRSKKPLLETQHKWKHLLKVIKSQPADEEGIGSRSIPLVEEHNTMPFYPVSRDESTSISNTTTWAMVPYTPETLRSTPQSLFGGGRCSHGTESVHMENYTVNELRAIAKERNIKGYSKLRKSDLAQKLGITLAEGKKTSKRKETHG